MSTGTVRLHRVLRASPERVYRAFLEPGRFRRHERVEAVAVARAPAGAVSVSQVVTVRPNG